MSFKVRKETLDTVQAKIRKVSVMISLSLILGCVGFVSVYRSQLCSASGLKRLTGFQKKPELSNYEIVQNVSFMRQTAQSLLICSKLCIDRPDCVLLSYATTSGLCSGGKILNPSLGSVAASTGFTMYSLLTGSCSRSDYTYVAELRICIKFYNVSATKSIALSQGITDGGNLIRITSALKQNVIANEFTRQDTFGSYLWIDGTDVLVPKQWRYSDGSLFTYTNFEPSDVQNAGENCVIMFKPYGCKWADLRCTSTNGFACEMQAY